MNERPAVPLPDSALGKLLNAVEVVVQDHMPEDGPVDDPNVNELWIAYNALLADLAAAPGLRAQERERIIGSDRESLHLMLESLDSLAPGPGPDAVACGHVVRRLLDGDADLIRGRASERAETPDHA